MGRILKKGTFNPRPFLIFTTCLLLLLTFLKQTDGFASGQSQEIISRMDEKSYSGDDKHNAQSTPPLLRRLKREEGLPEDIDETGDNDGNECPDKTQLQDDNANSTRLITEKDVLIQNQTGGIAKLREDLLKLDDEAKKLFAEKQIELAPWKARHFRHTHGNSQLYLAARKEDEQGVKELTQLGADINSTYNYPETPIILAAVSRVDGNVALKIVKYLIDTEAEVIAPDGEGLKFSHKFASNESLLSLVKFHKLAKDLATQQTDTLLLLHGNGVDLTLFDKNGNSVLFYDAIGSEAHLLLSYLNLEQTYLEKAINAEDGTLVKLLVRWGTDLNGKNNQSETPLHLAASSKNKTFAIHITKFFINTGANVYAQDKGNRTFLHRMVTAIGGSTIDPTTFHDMSAFLIGKNLSGIFNATDYNGMNPFQLAVRRGVDIETGTLSLFKNNSVDFNAVEKDGNSVLWLAIFGNQKVKLLSDLVDLGANLNHLNKKDQSMLVAAAYKGNLELLKFFLKRGLNVNAQDENGDTPLHFAVSGNKKNSNLFKIVELLLIKGANNQIPNRMGWYPHQLFVTSMSSLPDRKKIHDYLYYPGSVTYD